MALVLKDRVKEQSTTTGTGTLTLSGAYDGYQAFSVIGDGNVTYYAIFDPATDDWEVGYGTYTASGTTLSRDFVYESSNSNNLVNFAAGTKEVFCTYPAEQAIYQETNGNLKLVNGVVEVSLDGTSGTTLPNATFQAFSTTNGYIQNNIQNLSGGADASSDFVATNDQGSDSAFYADMGINSSGFNSATYPLYTPNSGYVYSVGDGGANPSTMFVGSGDGDVVLHAGGFTTAHVVGTASGTDQSMTFEADVSVGGALDVTGAASFGSTVLLNQDPTLALQAATKQYVDQVSSSGLHIHDPVRVERGSNLTATYTQGGTTFNVTDISGGNTLTTSTTHGLSVNDQVWFTGTVGNGLSANVAYFIYSTPAGNQITLSTNFSGPQLTGLTNASGLTYPVRANSGEGATLTNSGAQAALVIDGVTVNTNDRVLVYGQTTAYQNGVYTVTNTGSGSTNWVLTRALDQDHYSPSDTNGMGAGDYFYVTSGATGAGESYVLTTTGEFIIGYDALTYTQFSGAVTYTGGTNIDVTGQTISLTGTVAATNGGTGTNTVTTGDLLYGSGTNAWSKLAAGGQYRVLTMGASTPEWNAVALNQANAVSGSLPEAHGGTNQSSYATGDTLYASATNTLSKLSGNTSTTKKYLNQTGTGSASQAPVWDTISATDIASGTLAVARGGTGLGSYSVGDIVYASGTGTLAGLADVATGNVLLSGGTNTAPAYGKVGLGTHVSGTLPIANGGTGNTSGQAASVASALTVNNSGSGDASGMTFNGSAAKTISYNTVGAPSTTGTNASGTWSISINGNAATATSATTAGSCSGNSATATTLIGDQSNWASYRSSAVANMLSWKNYGNGHVIFDASQSTSPTGSAVNNTDAQVAWSSTYPTLMGWNGANTYGVRVDSARVADNGIPSGTVMLFIQTSAPTGWTKSTAHDNKALRIVSGTAGSGGSVAFTTAFASQGVSGSISSTTATGSNSSTAAGGTVGDTALSTTQIPSHTHSFTTDSTSLTGSFAFTDNDSTGMAVRVRETSGVFTNTAGTTNFVNSNGVPAAANLPYLVNFNGTHSHTGTTAGTGSGGVHSHSFSGASHSHTFTGDAHSHSFSGTAINLAVQYVDAIIATKN